MVLDSEKNRVFMAVRVRSDTPSTTEVFKASSLEISYHDMPVCVLAEGEVVVAQIEEDEVFDLLGPPTHYYFGSSDPCWLMSEEEFARFTAQMSVPSSGGGMLSMHIELS